MKGFNSNIANMHSELLNEWDSTKNGKIKPEYVSVGSSVKYWWKCKKCGYCWSAKIFSRAEGRGCGACAGKVAVEERTDLATTYPTLVSQWDFNKNRDRTPNNITHGSRYNAY